MCRCVWPLLHKQRLPTTRWLSSIRAIASLQLVLLPSLRTCCLLKIDTYVGWRRSMFAVSFSVNHDRAIDCGMLQNEEAIGHALTRIRRFATFDIYELLRVLQTLYDCLGRATELTADAPFTKQLRLLVIDSLAAVISPVLGGRANGTINTLRTSAVSSVQSLMECARQVISS